MTKKKSSSEKNTEEKTDDDEDDGKIKIEILSAKIVKDRLALETKINGKDLMNFNLPKKLAESKEQLLAEIKERYLELKNNIENPPVEEVPDLVGVNKV